MAVPKLLQVRPHGSTGEYTEIKSPSAFTWSIEDVSNPDAGRTLDGIMHKERLAVGGQKRKLKLKWNVVRFGEDSKAILQAFTPEYIDVIYPDPQEGAAISKVFYTGSKEIEFTTWWDGNQLLTNLAFNIIEQ